jgi:hypothetical protein
VTAVERSVEEVTLLEVYGPGRGTPGGFPTWPDETRGDVSRRRRAIRATTRADRRADRVGLQRVGWQTARGVVGG